MREAYFRSMKIDLFQRQDKGKGGPLVWNALDLHFSAVGFNDILNNGKPQAGTAHFPGTGLVDPVEPFKDAGKMFLGDADAGIFNADFYEISTFVVRRWSFVEFLVSLNAER